MPKSNHLKLSVHRLILSFAIILLVGLLTITAHAGTVAPNYLAGVKVGDAASYQAVKAVYRTNNSTVFPEPQMVTDYNNSISETTSITLISSPARNITSTNYWTFNNATHYRTTTSFVNLLTGDGNNTENIIAAGLTAGQLIYNNVSATLPPTPTINDTRPMTILGATRQVNIYNFTVSVISGPFYSNGKVNLFWDQSSGMLVRGVIVENFTVTNPQTGEKVAFYLNLDVEMVATNIWMPPPNFSMLALPPTLAFASGSTSTPQVTVYGLFGFTGIVNLTTSVNSTSLSATCDSLPPVTLFPPYQSTSCHLVSSTVGVYNVTVKGTSGTLTHSVSIIATVSPAPNFSIIANTTSVAMIAGDTKALMINATSQNHFNGTITLSPSVSLPGLTAICGALAPISTSNPVASTNCELTSSMVGAYSVTVTGSYGTLTHSVSIIVEVSQPPDFQISANPTALTIAVGSTQSSQIGVYGEFGFTGTVNLQPSINATIGLTATCGSPGGITPLYPIAYANCNLTASIVGAYTVTVTGSYGTLTRSASVIVTVSPAPNFSITTNATSVTMLASDTKTIMLRAISQNGFRGTINLSTSISPSPGLTCTLSSNTIDLTYATTGTSSLSCHGVYWSYTLTIKGTSGSLTNQAPAISLKVQDFTLERSSPTISMNTGTPGTATITVNPQDGYTGTVSLSSIIDKSGLICSLSPTSINGGSSTLSCSGDPGTYTVTVTATSGSLSHKAQYTVTVTSPQQTPNQPASPILGLSPIVFYSIVGVAIAVIATASVTELRTRRKPVP